jgi:hypothetical protein
MVYGIGIYRCTRRCRVTTCTSKSPPSGDHPCPGAASLYRAALGIAASLLLSACKVEIIVPTGGKVISSENFECLSGERCVFDVRDTSFDRTFTAVPDPGYVFTRWQRLPASLCGNTVRPCRLSTTNFPGTAILESDNVYYLVPEFRSLDIDYWSQTLKEIRNQAFTSDAFLYSLVPDPDSCDAGALRQAAKQRALEAVNQVRSLNDLAPVDYDSSYDVEMQETSVVQAANNYINHFPDPGDACYSDAAATGARTSNLTAGPQDDPAAHVFGWTNDNRNVGRLEAAGHRRWIQFPQLGQISYGQVSGFGALKVFSFGLPPNTVPPDLDFVAMPYRDYPYVLVSQGSEPTPWSLSMVPAGDPAVPFDYFSGATVSVIESVSGTGLPVHSLYTDTEGFGLANFLSWQVDGWEYDTEYTVSIRGIQLPGGSSRDISYPVVLDRFNLLDLKDPLEPGDSGSASLLQGSFNSARDRDSYTVRLSGRTTITGQSNFSNQAFFVLVYDFQKRLVQSSDQQIAANFPTGQYTVIVSPCDDEGLCYQGVQTYSVTIN